jgi:ankyrin repeat protein
MCMGTEVLAAAAVGSLPILRLPVKTGANIHARDHRGYNALLVAARYSGCPKMLHELKELRVHSQEKGYDGRSSLYLASDKGNYEAASLLLSRGHRFGEVDFSSRSAF